MPQKGGKKDMEGFFVHVFANVCPMMETHALGQGVRLFAWGHVDHSVKVLEKHVLSIPN